MEDLEERMEAQKKQFAGGEKQRTEITKERNNLLDDLEQVKLIKVTI